MALISRMVAVKVMGSSPVCPALDCTMDTGATGRPAKRIGHRLPLAPPMAGKLHTAHFYLGPRKRRALSVPRGRPYATRPAPFHVAAPDGTRLLQHPHQPNINQTLAMYGLCCVMFTLARDR